MEGKEIEPEKYTQPIIDKHKKINEIWEQALTVFDETGLTPSQLQSELEKAKELIEEARKEITEYKTKHGILGHLGRIQDKLSTFLEGSGNKTK